VVGPRAKRTTALKVIERFQVSKTFACQVLGLNRSTLDYKPVFKDEVAIRSRMTELCERHRRFGCPRIHWYLHKESLVINYKRTERIYQDMGLQLKNRKKKNKSNVIRMPLPKASVENQIWSMDFIHDRLEEGRKLKILNVVDDFTKICVGQVVASSITGDDLIRFFSGFEKLPFFIRCDNGPEFWANSFQAWAHGKVNFDFIDPGKPTQNAYIESFNGRFRDECLNEHVFHSIEHAEKLIRKWRKEYNEQRPHSSLGMKTPKEFAEEKKVVTI
jgi:putative transposase